jgi:hypothetical protein
MFSQYPDRAIPYMHYNPLLLVDPFATYPLCFISNLAAFHTYTAVWTENSITISYGQTCLTDDWVPGRPLVKPEPFDPATAPLPATREVDYVRAWK